MKILMINVVCGIRSTGRICTDLAVALESQGHEVKIAYGRENVPDRYKKYAIRIGNDVDVVMHGAKSRMFDRCGFGSESATRKFIKWVKEYDPEIIHLHNLHGYYINIEVLFDYLRTCGKKIIWTLHDCWAFTGHAAFCESANCVKWKTGCSNCPKKNDYPKAMADGSSYNWKRKRAIFSGIPNMTLVTPSMWLSDLVCESFLHEYQLEVIHNGIDTDLFRMLDQDSDNRLQFGSKRIILGVAAFWDARKGLNDFIALNEMIDNDRYVVVLVGLDKKQLHSLPKNMIGIGKTDTVEDLVKLYNDAYVFVNPTYEDTYPTTNLESIACGTPVITYKTGGSGESAQLYGKIVEKGNVRELADAIGAIDPSKRQVDISAISKNAFVNKYISVYNVENDGDGELIS